MLDRFNRKINYLRISYTDRCNLRCKYCMPKEGIQLYSHSEILSIEEIVEVAREAAELGVTKVRITGGEPLVRKGVVDLVAKLRSIKEIEDLAITTNGTLLEQYAGFLAKAGLNRVNISLDTLNPEKFKEITRGGNIQDTLQGIKAAQKVNLNPIKINCVIEKSSDEADAKEVKEFCEKNGLLVRFIRKMDLTQGDYWKIDGGTGGFCERCNRLRLTSNGLIKPCLFNNISFDIRKLGIQKALVDAIYYKPSRGQKNERNEFYNIGG